MFKLRIRSFFALFFVTACLIGSNHVFSCNEEIDKRPASFASLPFEILSHIIQDYEEVTEISKLFLVNRQFHACLQDDSFWATVAKRKNLKKSISELPWRLVCISDKFFKNGMKAYDADNLLESFLIFNKAAYLGHIDSMQMVGLLLMYQDPQLIPSRLPRPSQALKYLRASLLPSYELSSGNEKVDQFIDLFSRRKIDAALKVLAEIDPYQKPDQFPELIILSESDSALRSYAHHLLKSEKKAAVKKAYQQLAELHKERKTTNLQKYALTISDFSHKKIRQRGLEILTDLRRQGHNGTVYNLLAEFHHQKVNEDMKKYKNFLRLAALLGDQFSISDLAGQLLRKTLFSDLPNIPCEVTEGVYWSHFLKNDFAFEITRLYQEGVSHHSATKAIYKGSPLRVVEILTSYLADKYEQTVLISAYKLAKIFGGYEFNMQMMVHYEAAKQYYPLVRQHAEKLIKQQNIYAAYILGNFYHHGLGVPQDHSQATELLWQALDIYRNKFGSYKYFYLESYVVHIGGIFCELAELSEKEGNLSQAADYYFKASRGGVLSHELLENLARQGCTKARTYLKDPLLNKIENSESEDEDSESEDEEELSS